MATPQVDKDRAILTRSGVGVTASVVQRSDLRFSRVAIDRPTLIVLRAGTKTLQSARGEWTLRGGDAIAIAGGQTVDMTNRLSAKGTYEARWLVWDATIIAAFEDRALSKTPLVDAASLGRTDPSFSAAFDRALEAIGDVQTVPHDVAQHRLAEVLVWLSLRGVRFSKADNPSLATKVRRLFESSLAQSWTAADVAEHLALSEATLRRHLAAEGATLSDLLVDTRMSFAMMLLQSTDQAVNRIALEVGYESASRFAIRFRSRFGFPPTAIRGHARPSASSGDIGAGSEPAPESRPS